MNTVTPNILDIEEVCEEIPERESITIGEAARMGEYHPAIIVSKHQAYKEILDMIRPLMAPHPVVIAGGAIRDMYVRHDAKLIRDYDVFVLGCSEYEVPSLSTKLQETIQGSMYPSYPGLRGEPTVLGVWNSHYPLDRITEDTGISILEVKNNGPYTPVQVIFSKAPTVEKLFDTFDWNICKFAYDLKTVWDIGKRDFYNRGMTLNHVANPFRTLRRGFRLQDRLNTNIAVGQIETLASLILLDAGSSR